MSDRSPSKSKKIWKFLFALSLVLNLVIIGAIAGVLMRLGTGHMAGKDGPKQRAVGSLYMYALDFDAKRALVREMRSQKPKPKMNRPHSQAQYRLAIELLQSPDFDVLVFKVMN